MFARADILVNELNYKKCESNWNYVNKQSKYGVKKDTYEKPSAIIGPVTELDKMIKKYRDQSAMDPNCITALNEKADLCVIDNLRISLSVLD
jgi:hypothetical protein